MRAESYVGQGVLVLDSGGRDQVTHWRQLLATGNIDAR